MAKAQTETTAQEATTVAATADSGQGRAIILTLNGKFAEKVGVPEGSTMKRTDFIRHRFQTGKASRGAIAKELTEIQGKDVAYQIVFQATKGLVGGPDKPVEGEAAPVAEGDTAAA